MGKSGFTLLELLVVLAVVGLLLSISVPLLSGGSGGTEVKAKARELAAALRLSRSEAITKNKTISALIDVRGRRFLTTEPKPGTFPKDLTVSLRPVAGTWSALGDRKAARPILFFPDGSSTGGTISLAREGFVHDVRIDWLTGHVSIEVPRQSAP